MFSGLYAKLAAIGGIIVSFLYLLLKIETQEKKEAKREADVLKARLLFRKTRERIQKESKKELARRKAGIVKEIEKSEEEFKGLDNLTDSNDF